MRKVEIEKNDPEFQDYLDDLCTTCLRTRSDCNSEPKNRKGFDGKTSIVIGCNNYICVTMSDLDKKIDKIEDEFETHQEMKERLEKRLAKAINALEQIDTLIYAKGIQLGSNEFQSLLLSRDDYFKVRALCCDIIRKEK